MSDFQLWALWLQVSDLSKPELGYFENENDSNSSSLMRLSRALKVYIKQTSGRECIFWECQIQNSIIIIHGIRINYYIRIHYYNILKHFAWYPTVYGVVSHSIWLVTDISYYYCCYNYCTIINHYRASRELTCRSLSYGFTFDFRLKHLFLPCFWQDFCPLASSLWPSIFGQLLGHLFFMASSVSHVDSFWSTASLTLTSVLFL